MNRTIDLYQFTDYRAFLNAHLAEKKRSQPSFSTRSWCKKLGVSSPATINMILRGLRDPGPDVLDRLVRYFRFSQSQSQYFEKLVRLSKAKRKNSESFVRALEDLRRIHPEKKFDLVDFDTFAIVSNWYYFALREMLGSENFREDPEWLSKRLGRKVLPKRIDDAIRLMLKHKLITRNKAGSLESASAQVTTQPDVANEAVKRFHEQMSEIGQQAIREVAVDYRDFGGSTFNVDIQDLPALKAELRRARRRIYQKYEKPHANHTYQLNFQLFPLTRVDAPESKK